MYPYLKADMEQGLYSEESALELVKDFFLSFNKDSDLYPGVQQGNNGQSMMLGGIDADGVFLVGIELLLLGHRAVVDVTVHENGRTVHAVQHVLLFEHREVLADRHLRNLHQRGERRHRYGVLLTHDLHDAVLTFVQMNHLVRIFHRSS